MKRGKARERMPTRWDYLKRVRVRNKNNNQWFGQRQGGRRVEVPPKRDGGTGEGTGAQPQFEGVKGSL